MTICIALLIAFIVIAEVHIFVKLRVVKMEFSREIDDSKIAEVHYEDCVNRNKQSSDVIRSTYLTVVFVSSLLMLLYNNATS